MPFDGLTMHQLTKEIKDLVVDAKIDKIHQPENDEIVLHLRKNKSNFALLLSSDSNLPYFNIVDQKKKNPQTAPMFCMLLRKHLGGGKIIGFEQLELERVLIITISSKDELGNFSDKKIIFEIMGKHSNISLIDHEDKIIDCIKRIPLGVNRFRQLFPGISYLYPPNEKMDPRVVDKEAFSKILWGEEPLFKALYLNFQGFSPILAKEVCLMANLDTNRQASDLKASEKETLYIAMKNFIHDVLEDRVKPQVIYKKGFGLKDLSLVPLTPYDDQYDVTYYESVIDMVNGYYSNKNTVNKLLQRSHHLRKSIQSKIDRLKKKIKYLKKDLLEAEKADRYKIKGELILAYIYQVEKGMSSVTLNNFYDQEKPITIDLDHRLSPSDNAQAYFKKYSKLKTAQIKVKEQLKLTADEIKYLEQVLVSAEQAVDEETIDEIKEELILSGYLRRKVKHQKKKNKASSPHHYITSDGYHVYVGKNNFQNDHLTFKDAHKTDLWLHTKDIPGSHVILKDPGDPLPETGLLEAANIAAYHSKGQNSSQVPVDYTPVKNIKKPNGGKPGMVIFHTHQTLFVTPDENLVTSLMADKKTKNS